ncbi:MAG: carboxypeptidase family protein [Proteobacteria bacterium]|nr:carboxypeptidase family protein [Pseudomonadota bacterium]
MQTSSCFDGGNIEVLDSTNPADIQLEIRPDKESDFYQWFYFRVTGAKGQPCRLRIMNAAGAAYPKGWENYQAVCSSDGRLWARIETSYENGVLEINCTPKSDAIYIAYFAPYSQERHASLISRITQNNNVQLEVLGKTIDGRDMDLICIGEPEVNKLNVWAIARQHPGETMAQWWMEGFLQQLTDDSDPAAQGLLEKAVIHVVPNMNPDGSFRGHLRTNAVGSNLNREWLEPSMERSPEVLLVREKMHLIGVDFCLDVHGDEALPYNFIAGTEGVPSWNDERQAKLEKFKQLLKVHSPDFQTEHGYPPNSAGKANMALCSNYIAEHFGCPAMTLEMPFKDSAITPDYEFGWSPGRASELGGSCLAAIADFCVETLSRVNCKQ